MTEELIWDGLGGSKGKESACNARKFDPWVGKIREGNGYPLQYSCLENSMDRRAWWVTVHGVPKELDMTKQLILSQRPNHKSKP